VVVEKDGVSRITSPEEVRVDETILDAGPATVTMLDGYIAQAKNGVMEWTLWRL